MSFLENVNSKESSSDNVKDKQANFLEAARDLYIETVENEKLYEILQSLIKLEPGNEDYQESLELITYPEGYYTSPLSEELNNEYKEKLKYLYELYGNSGVNGVIQHLKENLDYFQLEGRDNAVHINGFIETEFYYGSKVYYGETDKLGWPSGTGIALCHDNGVTGYWLYIGEWKDGHREGDGSYFYVNNVGGLNSFIGEWKNDKPNGKGVIYENTAPSYKNYIKWTGTFIDGYYDGEFIQEFSGPRDYEAAGHVAQRLHKYEMGAPVPIEEGTKGFIFL